MCTGTWSGHRLRFIHRCNPWCWTGTGHSMEPWAASATLSAPAPLLCFLPPVPPHCNQRQPLKIQGWPSSKTCHGSLSEELPQTCPQSSHSQPMLSSLNFLCKGCFHSRECPSLPSPSDSFLSPSRRTQEGRLSLEPPSLSGPTLAPLIRNPSSASGCIPICLYIRLVLLQSRGWGWFFRPSTGLAAGVTLGQLETTLGELERDKSLSLRVRL